MKIFLIVGTRPEYIKMYPVYKHFWDRSQQQEIDIKWVFSSQHQELVQDLDEFFKIKPDFVFNLQGLDREVPDELHLTQLANLILQEASSLFYQEKPDLVVLQGDTFTAQQCALAAFYQHITVAHVEAGVRTNNIYSPFPEELARRILSQVSSLNFAPTPLALNTLEAEKILFKKQSFNFHTGNTVIDTLQHAVNTINSDDFDWSKFNSATHAFSNNEKINLIRHCEDSHKKTILVTAHRRENSEQAQQNLANAIYRILEKYKGEDLEFIVSIHRNPLARQAFSELHDKTKREGLNNILFLEAINYPLFIKLMMSSYFIVTDSGGIQEEAPYLSKPVLVFRNETERVEGIDHGLAKLVGTDEHLIHGAMLELLTDDKAYKAMVKENLQPYGDGLAASRIADVSLLYLRDQAG